METNEHKIGNVQILSKDKYAKYDMDNASTELEGYRGKNYIRLSTELLTELVDELRNNPESSYITHCNDLIKYNDYIPANMSAIIKRCGLNRALCEVASSRVMNYFGAPTTYEKVFKLPANPNATTSISNYVVASVDCQSFDHEVWTLEDIGIELTMDLERDIPMIERAVEKLFFKKKYSLNFNRVVTRKDFDAIKSKIVRDYVYSFLIRKFILRDRDTHSGNSAIIIEPKSMSIQSYINFDYEDTLGNKYEPDRYAYDQMKYALLMYPDVFKKFKTKVDELISINYDAQKLNLVNMLEKGLPTADKEISHKIAEALYDSSMLTSRVARNVIRQVFLSSANYEKFVR